MCSENSTRRHLGFKFEAHLCADNNFANHDNASNFIAADIGDGQGGRRQHPSGPLPGYGESHQHTPCAVKAGHDTTKRWPPTDDLST